MAGRRVSTSSSLAAFQLAARRSRNCPTPGDLPGLSQPISSKAYTPVYATYAPATSSSLRPSVERLRCIVARRVQSRRPMPQKIHARTTPDVVTHPHPLITPAANYDQSAAISRKSPDVNSANRLDVSSARNRSPCRCFPEDAFTSKTNVNERGLTPFTCPFTSESNPPSSFQNTRQGKLRKHH